MDPNNIDPNQQPIQPAFTPPQPPVMPESITPAQTPPPQVAPQTQPAAFTPAPMPVQKKSKTGLIIALAVGIPVLLIAALLTFFIIFSSGAIQSKARAAAFMSDVTAGDVDSAVKLTGDESSRSFMTSAAAKLKGNSFALSDSEYNSTGNSYYLYTLTGNTYTSARVIVVKENGKRLVGSLVYDTQKLALKPGASATTQQTTTTTTQPTGCFAPSDYNTALGYNNTISFSETSPYTTNVHFLADSLEYDGSFQDGYVGTVAKIVTTNTGKDYKVHLNGSVATTAAVDKSFANQRADKVKQSLIAKGVAESNIVVDAPQNVSDMGGATTEVAKQTARVVVIKFVPGCTTTASTSSSDR